MRVAIMQPYFMPYAGYFRLMATVDLFVSYNCVQFPRRGWVHRNQLTHLNGNKEWLTLPLMKAGRDATRICDLKFTENAQVEWEERMSQFPALRQETPWMPQMRVLSGMPCDYLFHGLKMVSRILGYECQFASSGSLELSPEIRGEDRILAIAKHFGATEYINASGGSELYDAGRFSAEGITLKFLTPYDGSYTSILERLQKENAADMAAEIISNCRFQPV